MVCSASSQAGFSDPQLEDMHRADLTTSCFIAGDEDRVSCGISYKLKTVNFDPPYPTE
jgi:hypothetical protein